MPSTAHTSGYSRERSFLLMWIPGDHIDSQLRFSNVSDLATEASDRRDTGGGKVRRGGGCVGSPPNNRGGDQAAPLSPVSKHMRASGEPQNSRETRVERLAHAMSQGTSSTPNKKTRCRRSQGLSQQCTSGPFSLDDRSSVLRHAEMRCHAYDDRGMARATPASGLNSHSGLAHPLSAAWPQQTLIGAASRFLGTGWRCGSVGRMLV